MKTFFWLFILNSLWFTSLAGHKVFFCNEEVNLSDEIVAEKLMEFIKKQIPTSKLASLRYKTNLWFPWLEAQLLKYGLPSDLKYLPIVESQFKNVAHSAAGASGLWQIMPETGKGLGLTVNPPYRDDRLDPGLSTIAACKLLYSYYHLVKKWNNGKGSWPLTCAAYNWGPGNIKRVMSQQGNNYFHLSLPKETATYVYKIIAIKELWEHPERYIKNFDRNVFDRSNMAAAEMEAKKNRRENAYKVESNGEEIEIELLDDEIEEDNHQTYDDKIFELKAESFDLPLNGKREKILSFSKPIQYDELVATLVGSNKAFHDGDLVAIKLKENLVLPNGDFTKKGSIVKGNGWIVDDRIMVNFSDDVEVLYDEKKGIPLELINKPEVVLLLKVLIE